MVLEWNQPGGMGAVRVLRLGMKPAGDKRVILSNNAGHVRRCLFPIGHVRYA